MLDCFQLNTSIYSVDPLLVVFYVSHPNACFQANLYSRECSFHADF